MSLEMDCYEHVVSRMVIGPTTIRMEFESENFEHVKQAAQHHAEKYSDQFLHFRSNRAIREGVPVRTMSVTFTREAPSGHS